MLATPQLSKAIGLPKATPVAEHWPGSVLVVMLAGQAVIAGGWLSTTVTICVQLVILPAMSVTVQWTSVGPTGNCVGASLISDATAQLSLVVGLPKPTPLA